MHVMPFSAYNPKHATSSLYAVMLHDHAKQASPAHTFTFTLQSSTKDSANMDLLPTSARQDELVVVNIFEIVYRRRLDQFKSHLYGRLLLKKGSSPPKMTELKEVLNALWKASAMWSLVSLSRGFYNIGFS